MPVLFAPILTRFAAEILVAAGSARQPGRHRRRIPDRLQPAGRRFPRIAVAALLYRADSGRGDGSEGRRPGGFGKRVVPRVRRAKRAWVNGLRRLVAATPCAWRRLRGGRGGGSRVQPLRRGRLVGAEDAGGRTDRPGILQRLADRAALAGQGRPHRNEPDLHVGARPVAAGYGHHHGGGGQDFQGVYQRKTGDPRRAGPSIRKACPPPTPKRPTTKAC
jgi:hypothetical protein